MKPSTKSKILIGLSSILALGGCKRSEAPKSPTLEELTRTVTELTTTYNVNYGPAQNAFMSSIFDGTFDEKEQETVYGLFNAARNARNEQIEYLLDFATCPINP